MLWLVGEIAYQVVIKTWAVSLLSAVLKVHVGCEHFLSLATSDQYNLILVVDLFIMLLFFFLPLKACTYYANSCIFSPAYFKPTVANAVLNVLLLLHRHCVWSRLFVIGCRSLSLAFMCGLVRPAIVHDVLGLMDCRPLCAVSTWTMVWLTLLRRYPVFPTRRSSCAGWLRCSCNMVSRGQTFPTLSTSSLPHTSPTRTRNPASLTYWSEFALDGCVGVACEPSLTMMSTSSAVSLSCHRFGGLFVKHDGVTLSGLVGKVF